MNNHHYTSLEEIWEEVFAIRNGFSKPAEVAKKIENSIGMGYCLELYRDVEEKAADPDEEVADIYREIGMDEDDDNNLRQLK